MMEKEGKSHKRPWFLTVLCYLTIFWSSYMMVSSVSSLTNLDQTVVLMKQSMERAQSIFESTLGNDPTALEKLEQMMGDIQAGSTRTNLRDHYFFLLVVSLLSLVGANMMLRLQKNGFRLYVLGNVIGVVAPLLVFGTDNFLGYAYALSSGLFGILFVLLYALKIKYMH